MPLLKSRKGKSAAKKPVVKVKPAVPKKPSTNRKAVKQRMTENKIDRARHYGFDWMNHPGAASEKSHKRLTEKRKWSSPSQIKRYQKQEAKNELRAEKRALKAANKPQKRITLRGRGGGGGGIGLFGTRIR